MLFMGNTGMPDLRPFVTLLVLAGCLHGADFHVSPAGAGSADGSSPENAVPGASASSVFNSRMQSGDRLLFGAGLYENLGLSLVTGGSADRPKIVEGARGAVMVSTWAIAKPDKGATAVTLAPGLRHVVFRNLLFQRYCMVVRADRAPENPRGHLVFENVSMEWMRHGFYLSDCDDLSFSGCKMKRYSKHGFRFEQGCDRVVLKACEADCSEGDPAWETQTELFPFGFFLNDGGAPNTGFLLESCVARNHIKSNQTVKYTNGDGFVVEGNSRDVVFRGCRALRNQDGGFDLKVMDVRLGDCVATGNRRDYRIWRSGTLTNCFGGWSQAGIWIKDGPVKASRCTFLDHRRSAIETEKAAGRLTLADCLLGSSQPDFVAAIGSFEGGDSTITAKSAAELGIVTPKSSWDGIGGAMDSAKFPDKGYHSP